MPKLKAIYDAESEIPDGYTDLYTERNNRFELTGVEGFKTEADVARVTEALRKEKSDHKETRERLTKFGEIDPETLPAQLEELTAAKAQLEAFTKDGKLDETKLEPIIEARINRALGPVQRDKVAVERRLADAQKVIVERETEVTSLKGNIVRGKVEGALRDAAIASKLIATAIDDAVMVGANVFEVTDDGRILTKDGVGITAGLAPKEWFKDMQDARPHWWPQSQGGGSGGGRGGFPNRAENPWSPEGWNITRQGAFVRQHGVEKAAAAASAVGSSIGSTKPPAKAA